MDDGKKFNSYMMDDFAKVVRYGKDDEPDKYGFTKKMHKIWDLVEDEKSLSDADFKATEADKAFYDQYKSLYDWEKEQRGRPYKFPRYVME